VSTCGRLAIRVAFFGCFKRLVDTFLGSQKSGASRPSPGREENGVDSGRARFAGHTRRRREGGDDVDPDELEEAVCHLPAMRRGWVLRYDTPDSRDGSPILKRNFACHSRVPANAAPRRPARPAVSHRQPPRSPLTPASSRFFTRAAIQRVSQSERARQLATATLGYTSAALAASELISRLTTDAAAFIDAEPDAPIPDSIRQAVRLVNTPELEECAARVSSGVARGVAGAASAVMGGDAGDANAGPSAAERVVDKLLDPRNWGVVSVVVGGATRQTLETIIDVWRESAAASRGNGVDRDNDFRSESNDDARGGALESALASALRVAASDDGRSVLLDVCSTFVSQMVGTYLDKTAGSNTFDDFFAAALAASNREAFGDIAGRVTGEAVRTVVEAVSPAAAAASRRAQQRAARGAEEAASGDTDGDGRDGDGDGDGVFGTGTSRSARDLFPDSPRDVFARDADSSPPSAASASDSPRPGPARVFPASARRRPFRRARSPDSAAEAAALFTSALVNDAAPRVFAAFASPDGRRLVADVAGTCAASATRSLVLSVRDAVFFADSRFTRDAFVSGKTGRDFFKTKLLDAARVALAATFILWIVASALSSLVSVAQFLGWNTGVIYAADVLEPLSDAGNAAVAESVAKSGWWGKV
jgi:hypothetical protein